MIGSGMGNGRQVARIEGLSASFAMLVVSRVHHPLWQARKNASRIEQREVPDSVAGVASSDNRTDDLGRRYGTVTHCDRRGASPPSGGPRRWGK
jgi:hypothetical protein